MKNSHMVGAIFILVLGFTCGWLFSGAQKQTVPQAPSAAGSAPAVFKNFAPQVITALQARVLKGDCPMCGKNEWVVHEVPVSIPVYEENGRVKFPGTSMPMAAMICKHCGFTAFHSLGALELLKNLPATAPATAPATGAGPKFEE